MVFKDSEKGDLKFVCGLDEAGRGPLAGPVVAGAVILPDDFPFEILNDSKKLSEKKRLAAETIIKEKALWGVGIVDHETIDEINILQASMKAMEIAFEMLLLKIPLWNENASMVRHGSPTSTIVEVSKISAITDGTSVPKISVPVRCEPKADGKYPCVMAASIIAKTQRDALMVEYDKLYPEYGYKKHKGYPTKEHLEICNKIGPSPIQRLTFAVKKLPVL